MALVAAPDSFAWAAAGGRTAYPRLAVALNPLVIHTVLTLAAYSIPVDIVLGQTIFSVLSVVFFSSCMFLGASPAGRRVLRGPGRVCGGAGLVSGADSAISLSFRSMFDSLPDELQDREAHAAIVHALHRSYEVNRERHDPAVGDDLMTFGLLVSKSAAFYLEPVVNSVPGGWARIVQNSLAMRVGAADLRHHKVGDSETDDPYRSFPSHAGPAARMPGRTGQLELPFTVFQPDRAGRVYYDWVICSYGNPEEGLRAVRLQAVGVHRALDGAISKWEDVVTLFDASEDDMSGGLFPVVRPQPPTDDVVVVPEPVVALRDDVAAEGTDAEP